MNHTDDVAPHGDWRRRPLTRVLVALLGWWSCGLCYAVDFPSLPLQTGVTQPAPNVIFILDDSRSMTGETLDTGITWCTTSSCTPAPSMNNSDSDGVGSPYTKNPLSYNPAIVYQPWATANTANTNLERLPDARYTAASRDAQLATGSLVNLADDVQTFYVPKPNTDPLNRRNYYRYQIRKNGTQVVRAEWVNTAPATLSVATLQTWTNITGGENYWGGVNNSTTGGNNSCANSNGTFVISVPEDATRVVVSATGATGTNDNPDLYIRTGNNNPCTGNYSWRSNSSGANEEITVDNPNSGQTWRIGVYNNASGSGDRTFANLTLTVQYYFEPNGCSTAASGTWGWKNCVDITSSGDASTGVRTLDAEKQNYANWYQYHRTRMKTAKAGGSEAFATLDENFRVGLMGLYPSGTYQQVLGATGGSAPTTTAPGNLSNVIPVATNGGLFIGDNRKDWFDHLHGMVDKNATPLRKALDAAGKYFSNARAYQSTVGGETTYLACRQNFAILTTDGYWNNFNNSDDPDSNYADDKISGDEEDGDVITGPPNKTYQYQRAAPYWYNISGSDRNDPTTLADIAMHYWKKDLRTSDVTGYPGSAENRVPSSTANPAFWQHMVTFGVGLGVRGELTDAQVQHAMQGTGTAANGGFWPAPVHATNANDNPENVDDLRHAALNSRGSYINANDSVEFAAGIGEALNRIGERRGSASNVLANSTSISTDSFVFQATYTAGAWRGELLAYPISSAGIGQPQWRASERIPTWSSRKIFTRDASGGSTFPSSTQSSALSAPATALGLPGASALADYLKGDRSREKPSGVLRQRTMRNSLDQEIPALLGDIVNSSPFYVADNQTVFVGANDGMLHAFDATNTSTGGTERFAYVPRGISMSTLAETADPLYGTNTGTAPHRYFVDGPLVVSSRVRTPGVNYLVGGLGRGGRGVYGLNVTSPASFGTGDVLWDLTGADAPANMGNVISEPLISKLNTGTTAAVVANGPNSPSGTASLFIINLPDGAVLAELNTNTTNNGLSAPRAVDVNADGLVDYFFAGDLNGTLWRFDVSSPSTASWTVNKVFIGGATRPITSAPGAARDPNTGKIWIFFGTGRYITADDQADMTTQSYYGIEVGPLGADGVDLTRSSLQERQIHVVDAATGRRAFEPGQTGIDAGKQGWFIDLDQPAGVGERVITAPLIFDNILIFSSIVPPNQSTVNSCDAGGTGYINALDAFSGTGLQTPFFETEAPTLTDGSGNELPIGSLPITAGMPTAPILVGNQLVVGDSSGGTPFATPVNAPGGSSTRRVSWRELVDTQ